MSFYSGVLFHRTTIVEDGVTRTFPKRHNIARILGFRAELPTVQATSVRLRAQAHFFPENDLARNINTVGVHQVAGSRVLRDSAM